MLDFLKAAPPPAPTTAPMPAAAADYGPGTPAADGTASRLKSLADHSRFASHRRPLRALADALGDAETAALWRELPLHDVFAGVSGEPGQPARGRVLQGLYAVRAAAIFLPLLVSWVGIHGAVSAYRDRLGTDAEQGAQTFFREWLSGFDGELWLSFDRMAGAVVACVLILIAVSVAIEWFQRSVAAETEAIETGLRGELDGALTEAALHLRATPGFSAEALERRFGETVGLAADLGVTLVEAAQSVNGELAALEAAGSEFRAVATGLESGARSIADAATRLDTTVASERDRAVQAFHDAGIATAAAIGVAAQGLQDNAAEHQDQAAMILREVGASVIEAVGQGERHRDALGRLLRDNREEDASALARAIASEQSRFADDMRRAGEDIAAKLAGVVEIEADQQLRDRLDQIARTGDQMTMTVDRLAQAVDRLGQGLGEPHLPVPVTPKRRWFGR
ncbi:hypothetical protein GCM10009830_20640 [Glycomyces endophyticus]|uniref:Methyl-accepting chemotaxis protein n=1 Tax=Glycomyces endophyticus TaxID=480996 RepID=A0ABN2GND2_9ACTN